MEVKICECEETQGGCGRPSCGGACSLDIYFKKVRPEAALGLQAETFAVVRVSRARTRHSMSRAAVGDCLECRVIGTTVCVGACSARRCD